MSLHAYATATRAPRSSPFQRTRRIELVHCDDQRQWMHSTSLKAFWGSLPCSRPAAPPPGTGSINNSQTTITGQLVAPSAINQEFLDLDFRVNPTSTNVLCHAVYIFDNPKIFVGTISSNHYLNADTSLLLPRQRDFKCDPEWVFCNEFKKNPIKRSWRRLKNGIQSMSSPRRAQSCEWQRIATVAALERRNTG